MVRKQIEFATVIFSIGLRSHELPSHQVRPERLHEVQLTVLLRSLEVLEPVASGRSPFGDKVSDILSGRSSLFHLHVYV